MPCGKGGKCDIFYSYSYRYSFSSQVENIDMLINDDDDDDDVTTHDKLMKFCASTRGVSHTMFKYLKELIYEKEEAIIELNTLLEEEDRKSNLLEQELEIDKESIAILTQSIEMYELKVKNLENLDDKCARMLLLLILFLVKLLS
jgi:hypothetical protein